MKDNYEVAEMEVIRFDAEDIITSSGEPELPPVIEQFYYSETTPAEHSALQGHPDKTNEN